jgi:hypothetical protein
VSRKIIALIALSLYFFGVKSDAFAFDDIQTSAEVFYKLDPDNRVVNVLYNIDITNLSSQSYVENFNFMPSGLRPESVKAFQGEKELDIVFVENSYYKIVLADPAIGVGNKASFSLLFEDRSLYLGADSSWSFSIPTPKSAQEYKDYKLNLTISKKFLTNLFVSPSTNKYEMRGEEVVYSFEKEEVLGGPLRVFYGTSQDYSISLVWSLKNASLMPSIKDIKFPSNTPNQSVYLMSVRPRPQSIFKDKLGNTVARYIVGPITQIDVEAKFEISRLFDSVNEKHEIVLPEASPPTEGFISDFSKELRSFEDILFFTTNRLEYGFGEKQVDSISLEELVKGYSKAFCLDYTNLYSAIAESSGRKVATVIGYIVPPGGSKYRLLGNDLHSWVILEEGGELISLDPTRYDTGGGDLYKNNISLDQISFFIVEETGSINYDLLPTVSEVMTIASASGLPELFPWC